jgi:hypothetical protein
MSANQIGRIETRQLDIAHPGKLDHLGDIADEFADADRAARINVIGRAYLGSYLRNRHPDGGVHFAASFAAEREAVEISTA